MSQRKSTRLLFLILLMLVGLISAAPSPVGAQTGSTVILADFEGLNGPAAPAEFFVFAGSSSVVTTPISVPDTDPLARPGQSGDNGVLKVDFDVSDFGGFGQAFEVAGPQDWSAYESFNFWFYGSGSGLTYQAEISDNRSDPNTDTSERFDYEFTDTVAGWRLISIPFADFTRATDFQPGGAPDDGFTLTEIWAWAIVLPQGNDTVYFDDFFLGLRVVDDFESPLASDTDNDGNLIGFFKFEGPGATIDFDTTTTPPAPVPGSQPDNTVLQVDSNVPNGSWGGIVHAFENDAVDTWVTQDWSRYVGMGFWLYGNNTGKTLFVDILDNRAPGTTGDTAERYSYDIVDNFSGWQFIQIPFAAMARKEIGNGAPNDGLNLTEVHGWAFGIASAGQAFTSYLDDVVLYGNADVPELAVSFAANNFDIAEGTTGQIAVKLNRPLGDDDPDQVSVDYSTETIIAVEGRDFLPAAGTLTFVKGGPSELTFPLVTLDDNKYEGTERVILRLSNPVDVALGFIIQASASILDNEAFDPLLIDDFERFPHLWDASGGVLLANPEIAARDPLALPGQGAYEGILEATLPLPVDIIVRGRLCNQGNGVIPVVLLGSTDFNIRNVDHTTVSLGNAYESRINPQTGLPRRQEADFNRDGYLDLIFMFRFKETGLPCDPAVVPFNGLTYDGQPFTLRGSVVHFGRDFALGQDWSASNGLTMMVYGQGSGETITLELLDNRAPDPGPSGWSLVWSDEFNDPAGTPPNPAYWGYEIGDGTVNGIPGWGNAELQYYTNSTANAATDGNGNLVITAREADGSLLCYYGPCEYTSARLISHHRAEFAYGRIESRIRVPDGEAGLWPAFWSLGTDIGEVGWPQTGEIDIMEYVSRIPDEIFGTIHGPGYSGGASFGNTYNFPGGVAGKSHTFAIEWEPNRIKWFVNGNLYHTATPADVAPNPWVFNDPVFLLFNLAIGGNFGGTVSEALTFPQEMVIDYVRVYQGPDTAERFETTFVDDFTGWQELYIPFDAFSRSAGQPAGAPNDGLTLSEVWGYGFKLTANVNTDAVLLDQVRLVTPDEITVTNLNNSGPGSLRQAAGLVANGGTVIFDPGLAGGTIPLSSPLVIPAGRHVTIDAAAAPGLELSGGDSDRVLIVDAGSNATLKHLTVTDGYGWQLAGGILNNGTLTLDHVTVTDNMMATDAGDFWQGGGGIYNGDGATLHLVDSSVVGNNAGWSGGGIYSFFNTTTLIERSTIAGNVSNDVGGGLRLLGNATIINSTISGNESTGWYGGALFVTDGVVDLTNTTIADNVSPSFAQADVFVGTFTAANATLTLTNTIVASAAANCFYAPWGTGVVTLAAAHNNVFTDNTCFAGASDQVVGDAGLDSLANNGGPTLTHALQADSPAIDEADPDVCPATDQRGVERDAACDVGAFEFVP
jgi:beta-glucanase (GH16 family)